MHIALSVQFGRDDQLIFAQQLGVEHVVASVERRWDIETLAALKNRVEKTGLKLAGVEGLLTTDTEEAVAAVRAVEAAGIELISCVAGPATHGQRQPTGRGGALVGSDKTTIIVPQGPEAIVQAAQEAGVSIAWTGKSAHAGGGLDLPLSRLGDDPAAALAALEAPVFMARAWNRRGSEQAFLDDGDTNLPRVLLALEKTGFTGPLLASAPPGIAGDSEWGHKGRAFDLGYLKAILQTMQSR
jgi:hypothetical protein